MKVTKSIGRMLIQCGLQWFFAFMLLAGKTFPLFFFFFRNQTVMDIIIYKPSSANIHHHFFMTFSNIPPTICCCHHHVNHMSDGCMFFLLDRERELKIHRFTNQNNKPLTNGSSQRAFRMAAVEKLIKKPQTIWYTHHTVHRAWGSKLPLISFSFKWLITLPATAAVATLRTC